MDFANTVCELRGLVMIGGQAMKVNIEFDCTPEEARRFLGLPDVSKANEAYAEATAKLMKGAGSLEQLQEFAKQLAPMGEMGLKLFQQVMSAGVGGTKKGGG
jgi:Family of unknown function (DUF6489)